MVCLFPALFKQNLLSFIHLVYPLIPRTTVLHLLKCLNQDPHPSPWVSTLVRQLERNMGLKSEQPLYTPLCSQRVKELSQCLVGFGETGGWAKFFDSHAIESDAQSQSGLSEQGTQRKRKSSFVTLDSDGEEAVQQNKRIKMDVCGCECLDAAEQSIKEGKSERLESESPAETSDDGLQPAPDSPCDVLPEHLQVQSLMSSLKVIVCFHNVTCLISFITSDFYFCTIK